MNGWPKDSATTQSPAAKEACTCAIEGSLEFNGTTVPLLSFLGELFVPATFLADALHMDHETIFMDLIHPVHKERYGTRPLFVPDAERWLICVNAHAVTRLIGQVDPETWRLRDPHAAIH